MTQSIGFELKRALPITMTYYDWLLTYPYTSTFYVRDGTSDEDCNELIQAVRALSACVLGKYKIGHRSFVVTTFDEDKKAVSPYAMGTRKWQIQYHNSLGLSRSHTIPGSKVEHSRGGTQAGLKKAARDPNLNHEDWKHFLSVFKRVCVNPEGEAIPPLINVKPSNSNWPPKGAKKR